MKAILRRSGKRHGFPLSPFLFNTVLEVLAMAIRKEKEIKGIQIGREEVKLSLFADDMKLYLENPNNSTKKPLELINEFSKVAGLIYRNLLLLYTLMLKYQKEKANIYTYICIYMDPIHNQIKKNKIPRNKLNQGGERPRLWKLGEMDEQSWKRYKYIVFKD